MYDILIWAMLFLATWWHYSLSGTLKPIEPAGVKYLTKIQMDIEKYRCSKTPTPCKPCYPKMFTHLLLAIPHSCPCLMYVHMILGVEARLRSPTFFVFLVLNRGQYFPRSWSGC